MEPLEDWRSPNFEKDLGRLDRGGVSFEFLRRDDEYRAHYNSLMDQSSKDPDIAIAAREGLTRQWGLTFPS